MACTDAELEAARNYRKNYPGKARNAVYAWRKKNPKLIRQHNMLNLAKNRAKKKGLEATIDIEWIKENAERCQISNVEFDWTAKSQSARSPSIDRYDSSKGYTPDNCRVVCWAFNAAFGSWGEDEFNELWEAKQRFEENPSRVQFEDIPVGVYEVTE